MNPKKPRTPCLECGKEPDDWKYKYCSNKCQAAFQHAKYIDEWKRGIRKGLTSTGIVSNPIKRFLREKYNDKCCLCGWAETNPVTNKIPLVADHIDGNWRNNIESNLRLICPNCDSLTATYAALNKGRSKRVRAGSARSLMARSFVEE